MIYSKSGYFFLKVLPNIRIRLRSGPVRSGSGPVRYPVRFVADPVRSGPVEKTRSGRLLVSTHTLPSELAKNTMYPRPDPFLSGGKFPRLASE